MKFEAVADFRDGLVKLCCVASHSAGDPTYQQGYR